MSVWRSGFTSMVPFPERPLRLAATIAELATARRVRAAAQLLLAAAFVFVLVQLRSIWHDSHVDPAGIDWPALVGAFLLSVAGVGAGAFVWLAILRRLGVETRPRWTGVYFQAQLSKYIPGALWQYAGRATLGRSHGIPVRTIGLSIPIELAACALGAAVMSPLLLGWWGIALVVAFGLAVWAWDRRLAASASRPRESVAAGARAWLYYMLAWPVIGLGFWLTAHSLVAVSVHDAAVYVGAFCIAWLAGFVAVYAPGGLGVREAVLVALLAGRLGASDALVAAAVSRAMLTLVDLVLAGIGVGLLGRGRPLETPAVTAGDPPTPSSS
jgi:uncharacterized membrane protein YbhN (UPF0104 family)